MGPTWVLSAPCWPHEPCYQGCSCRSEPTVSQHWFWVKAWRQISDKWPWAYPDQDLWRQMTSQGRNMPNLHRIPLFRIGWAQHISFLGENIVMSFFTYHIYFHIKRLWFHFQHYVAITMYYIIIHRFLCPAFIIWICQDCCAKLQNSKLRSVTHIYCLFVSYMVCVSLAVFEERTVAITPWYTFYS